ALPLHPLFADKVSSEQLATGSFVASMRSFRPSRTAFDIMDKKRQHNSTLLRNIEVRLGVNLTNGIRKERAGAPLDEDDGEGDGEGETKATSEDNEDEKQYSAQGSRAVAVSQRRMRGRKKRKTAADFRGL